MAPALIAMECGFVFTVCPHEESNLDFRIRNPAFYPLNYGGVGVLPLGNAVPKGTRVVPRMGIFFRRGIGGMGNACVAGYPHLPHQ